ncbi:hypothetical protein WJX77_006769 [Trebouxia sp. C0004]
MLIEQAAEQWEMQDHPGWDIFEDDGASEALPVGPTGGSVRLAVHKPSVFFQSLLHCFPTDQRIHDTRTACLQKRCKDCAISADTARTRFQPQSQQHSNMPESASFASRAEGAPSQPSVRNFGLSLQMPSHDDSPHGSMPHGCGQSHGPVAMGSRHSYLSHAAPSSKPAQAECGMSQQTAMAGRRWIEPSTLAASEMQMQAQPSPASSGHQTLPSHASVNSIDPFMGDRAIVDRAVRHSNGHYPSQHQQQPQSSSFDLAEWSYPACDPNLGASAAAAAAAACSDEEIVCNVSGNSVSQQQIGNCLYRGCAAQPSPLSTTYLARGNGERSLAQPEPEQ